MTPAQLRVFAAIARHGSSRGGRWGTGVSEAAVSGHVSSLRKELGDELFTRSGSGISFTPGGLRLASRAVEMLGLQDQTLHEVRAAGDGQRILRIAVSSLFGEVAAPGLIELFSTRADDLQVEMSVSAPDQFPGFSRRAWSTSPIGPTRRTNPESIRVKEFLRYQMIAVVGRSHPLAARGRIHLSSHHQTWLLGPSAVDATSVACPDAASFRRAGVEPANLPEPFCCPRRGSGWKRRRAVRGALRHRRTRRRSFGSASLHQVSTPTAPGLLPGSGTKRRVFSSTNSSGSQYADGRFKPC